MTLPNQLDREEKLTQALDLNFGECKTGKRSRQVTISTFPHPTTDLLNRGPGLARALSLRDCSNQESLRIHSDSLLVRRPGEAWPRTGSEPSCHAGLLLYFLPLKFSYENQVIICSIPSPSPRRTVRHVLKLMGGRREGSNKRSHEEWLFHGSLLVPDENRVGG